jgi:hypothetical protein
MELYLHSHDLVPKEEPFSLLFEALTAVILKRIYYL